jgi:glycosyltransferase involved in cell wall biosynthesis
MDVLKFAFDSKDTALRTKIEISVIVPFYKAERYIEDCIRALLSQDLPSHNYEVIMVDNNSPDKSAEIVRRYPRIHLVSEQKQGAYAARNRGITEAKGAIIAFTDPDCLPSVDWLQNIGRVMLCPNVGIVLGSREFPSKSPALSMLAAYENAKAAYVFSSHLKEIYFGHTNNMAVKRVLFERLGRFLEVPRGADTVFVRQAVDACGVDVVSHSPDICVRHMEITGMSTLYRKEFVYGWSNQHNTDLMSFRPLTNAERFELFRETIEKTRCSILESAHFFCLLVVGGAYYELGRGRAIWSARQRRRREDFCDAQKSPQ